MITYKDIKTAVNLQLKKTGVEINGRNVKEGFNRPSFFVQLNNASRSGTESQVEKSLTVSIYYFPSDEYEYAVEVLDMQETLGNLFDLKLSVKDRQLDVDDFETSLIDGVLNASFDLAFSDGRNSTYHVSGEEQHSELMEELEFEME